MSALPHWSNDGPCAGDIEDAQIAMRERELLADRDAMRDLFEQDAAGQDSAELFSELVELRWILSRADTDPTVAGWLERTRKGMAAKAEKLAAEEARVGALLA